MSSAGDTPATALPRRDLRPRRTASPAREDASSADHRRQKRRRIEGDSDVESGPGADVKPEPRLEARRPPELVPASTSQRGAVLAQISTWDIAPADTPRPAAPPPRPAVPVELSDSEDPTLPNARPSVAAQDGPSEATPSRSAAIAASGAPVPEPLSAYTCPICFSPPTNATLTPCGHICCGQCLFTAVKSTIRRNMAIAMDRAPAALCPVCRAEIAGWDGRGGGVVGLNVQVLYSL